MSSATPDHSSVLVHHWSLGRAPALATIGVMGCLLLAAVTFFNEANLRVRSVDEYGADEQVLLRLAICAACGLYGLICIRQTKDDLLRFPGFWCVLLGLWAIVTAPLAVNVPHALGASLSFFSFILFAPALLCHVDSRRLIFVLLGTLCAYLAGCWIIHVFFPSVVHQLPAESTTLEYGRLGGLGHPNGTGRQAALAVCLALICGAQRWLSWKVVLLITFLGCITLIETWSRTSIIALMVGAAIVLRHLLQARGWLPAAYIFFFAGLAAVVAGVGMFGFDLGATLSGMSRTGDAGEIYTLTGRDVLWRFVIEEITRSPLAGYGWGCMRFVCIENDWGTHHAHNMFLNVMLASGLLGGLIVAAMVLHLTIGFFRHPQLFPDVVFGLVMFQGITGGSVFDVPIPASHTLLWFLALFWRQVSAAKQTANNESLGVVR